MPLSAHLGRVQSPEAHLRELGIELPDPPDPLGPYPAVQIVGDLLYTTAVLPIWNGELRYTGALGTQVSLADGVAAARLCGLNLLALIRANAGGSLDTVRQVMQVVGLVNSAPAFAQQSKVMNGLSELLYTVFGEVGRHSRTALATTELPRNATVQATAVVRLVPGVLGRRAEGTGEIAGTAVGDAASQATAMPVSGTPVERGLRVPEANGAEQ